MKTHTSQFKGHTPGPWRFHFGRGANPRYHIQNKGGFQIASTPPPDPNGPEFRSIDAALIAAAPTLLAQRDKLAEALEHCQKLCRECHGNGYVMLPKGGTVRCSHCGPAIALLAEVRGEL